MSGDNQQLDQKVEGLRADVNTQMSGIRTELKELTEALRVLVRLEGDQRRIWDAVTRIGKESDDHEHRIRDLMQALATVQVRGAVSEKGVGSVERWLYTGGGALVSSIVTFLVARASG